MEGCAGKANSPSSLACSLSLLVLTVLTVLYLTIAVTWEAMKVGTHTDVHLFESLAVGPAEAASKASRIQPRRHVAYSGRK